MSHFLRILSHSLSLTRPQPSYLRQQFVLEFKLDIRVNLYNQLKLSSFIAINLIGI